MIGRALALALLCAASASAQIPNITFSEPPSSIPIHPRFLASSGNGEVWFSDHFTITDRFIGRLDANGMVNKFAYPCPNCTAGTEALSFLSMTIGPDGNLWVPVFRGRVSDSAPLESAVVRVTQSGQHTVFPLSNAAAFASSGGFGHSAIAAGPDGNLWFTENNANRIGRITPAGAITEFTLPNVDSAPTHIVAGPDGALWFTELRGSRIGRITTAGAITEFPIQFTGTSIPRPHDIALGSDGNLWVTMEFGGPPGNNVTRVTSAGVMTTFALPNTNSLPQHFAAAPDGNLYFTLFGRNELARVRFSGAAKLIAPDADPAFEFSSIPAFGTGQAPNDLKLRLTLGAQYTLYGSTRTGTASPFADSSFLARVSFTPSPAPTPSPSPGPSTATSTGNQTSAGEIIDPVNTTTGELYESLPPDLIRSDGPMLVAFQRYYASRLATDNAITSALGTNWLHNFDWIVRNLNADGSRVGVVDSRGRVHAFARSGSSFTLESPLDFPVQLVQTATGYTFGDLLNEVVCSFNTAGRLTAIEDTHGNSLTLTYSGQNLSRVTDGLNRALTFSYDGSGHLTSVSDGARTVRFTYSGNNLATAIDALGNTTAYTYDASGRLLSTRRPRGNVAYAQTFDGEGRAVTQTTAGANTTAISYAAASTAVTDPAGGVVAHSHNTTAGGELTAFRDHANKLVQIGYDSDGRRTSVVDRLGFTTTIAYHAPSGKPSQVTLADGTRSSFAYGARTFNGISLYPLTRVTYPDNTSESFNYDANGNVISVVDRAGQTSTFTWNQRGQLLTATNPAGGVATYTYNADGSPASSRDSDTGATAYGYDAAGRLARITHPDQAFREFTYDADDRVTVVRNELGASAAFQYDANGNLTRATDFAGGAEQYEYDALDRVIRLVNPAGGVGSFTFNNRDLPASVTDPNNNTTAFTFDSRRRLESTADPAGKVSRFGFDDEAAPISFTNALNQTASRTVNPLGLTATLTDPLNRRVSLQRDSLQRITGISEPLGRATTLGRGPRGEITSFTRTGIGTSRVEYNNLGLPVTFTDFLNHVSRRTYTTAGRLASEVDPLGRTTRYSYNPLGLPSQVIFADAGTLDVTWDAAQNPTRLNFSGGPDLTFAYDADGRLTQTNLLSFTYDAAGRMTVANSDGFNVRATYDAGGRLTQLGYAESGTVNYTYDSRGNLATVSDTFSNTQTRFNYDDASRMIGIVRPNGVNTTYTYDAAGQPVRIQHGNLIDLRYTYNDAGDIVEEQSTGTLDPSTLPEAAFTGQSWAAGAASLDDPTAPDGIFDGQTFTYDAANQITSPGYGYDQRGRRTLSLNVGLTWDGADRLTRADNTIYDWNGLGNLRRRDTGLAGGRTGFVNAYQIPGTPPIVSADTAGNQFIFFYNPLNGKLLHGVTNQGPFFPHFNAEWDTIALTNSAGAVTDWYAYDPFGLPLGREGNHGQPFRFRGGYALYYDQGIGAVINNQRVYDPKTQQTLVPARESRLGFRGVEDLGGGLSAQFAIEARFSARKVRSTDPAASLEPLHFGPDRGGPVSTTTKIKLPARQFEIGGFETPQLSVREHLQILANRPPAPRAELPPLPRPYQRTQTQTSLDYLLALGDHSSSRRAFEEFLAFQKAEPDESLPSDLQALRHFKITVPSPPSQPPPVCPGSPPQKTPYEEIDEQYPFTPSGVLRGFVEFVESLF